MNRRISGSGPTSALVAKAGAALGAKLLGKAGRLEVAGRQGGVGQPFLHHIDQLLGGGDLHKSKVFVPGGCGHAVLD